MALLETLVVGVGAGIAKGVLKLWLRDFELAEQVGLSVLDIVKKKTRDLFAQNSANRQFEQISERVAKNVLQVFEVEGVGISDNGQIAVAEAAGETINHTGLSAELLTEYDLDPSKLRKHFLSNRPNATRDFSEAETALYHSIISDASQYIVDIASQMPSFTERTFAEVLKRETLLLDKADQILAEVRRLSEGTRDQGAEAARFENEYRRAVIRRCDHLELFGVDVSATSKRYRLSVAYVTLLVERQALDGQWPTHPERDEIAQDVEDEEEDHTEIIPVDQALASSQRLFIRGPAGSGKTTLLQWVAVHAASRTMEDELADWNDKIPFFIRLREFAEQALPDSKDFIGLISPAIAGGMPERWVHEQLKSGRAIVLVDGLDELPQDRRDEVRTWLDDLVHTFEHAYFIISSRPHAAEEGWLAKEGFRDAELQDMSMDDINAFIGHWHAAVREGLQDELKKAELDDFDVNLKEAVKRNRSIRKLATSPLLCAMLCALHRDRVKNLPSDRIELYRACCDMFLRRDLERRVTLHDYPDLGERQKRALLEDFAYWLIKNGWSEVTEQQADTRLNRKLGNLEHLPSGTTGKDARRLFVERSGILRQPTPGKIDFPHRTFQEFMAAQAAIDEGDVGVIVNNAHDDQWREVVVLAAGLARKNEAEDLIRGLIARGDEENKRRYELYLLAVGCLDTAIELGADVKKKVQNRLKKIVPPKNITAAKALASAGELVVPYLAYDSNLKAKEAAACVRALSLVGGETAWNALEEYASDNRVAVIKELSNGWKYSDNLEEYNKQVMSRLKAIDWSFSGTLTDLSPLSMSENLTRLDLSNCYQLRDLGPLSALASLTSLDLGWCRQLRDLGPLGRLTSLTSLDLNYCSGVTDLGPLLALPKLSELHLYGVSAKVPDELRLRVKRINP